MKKYDWVSTVKLNLFVFKLAGLWPQGSGYKFNFYLLHGIITTFILGFIQSFCQTWKLLTNFNDLQVVTETAFLSISESLVVVKMFYLALNMRSLKKLLINLNSDLFQPHSLDQIELVKPSLNTWRLMYNLLGSSITVAIIFWAMVPVLTNTIKQHRLPFMAWYPYDTTISPLYEITYIHQVASILYIAYVNVNLDTFIAAFSLYAGAQLDILCDNLKNMSPEVFRESLVVCVRRHREIIRYQEKFRCLFF